MNNSTESEKKRLDWIDHTKGLAILGIVVFHFFQNYPDRINLVSILDRNGVRIAFAAVDIFFVLAGFNTSYILASRARKTHQDEITTNWKYWLIKRLNRIYPAYILAVICSLLLYQIFGDIKNYSPLNFILSFLGLAGLKFQIINPGFWFFTVLLQAYLVTPIIFKFCKKQPQNFIILGIIGGTLTKLVCFIAGDKSDIFWYFLQNNFLGSYFFPLCLGFYWGIIYFDQQSFRKIDYFASATVFILGMIGYISLAVMKINIIYHLGFDMLFTPFFFLGCHLIFNYGNSLKNQIITGSLAGLSILGIYSYQIYLLHQPLYFVIFPILKKNIPLEPYSKIFICLGILTFLLTLYVTIFVMLEKLLRQLFEKIVNH